MKALVTRHKHNYYNWKKNGVAKNNLASNCSSYSIINFLSNLPSTAGPLVLCGQSDDSIRGTVFCAETGDEVKSCGLPARAQTGNKGRIRSAIISLNPLWS